MCGHNVNCQTEKTMKLLIASIKNNTITIGNDDQFGDIINSHTRHLTIHQIKGSLSHVNIVRKKLYS